MLDRAAAMTAARRGWATPPGRTPTRRLVPWAAGNRPPETGTAPRLSGEQGRPFIFSRVVPIERHVDHVARHAGFVEQRVVARAPRGGGGHPPGGVRLHPPDQCHKLF